MKAWHLRKGVSSTFNRDMHSCMVASPRSDSAASASTWRSRSAVSLRADASALSAAARSRALAWLRTKRCDIMGELGLAIEIHLGFLCGGFWHGLTSSVQRHRCGPGPAQLLSMLAHALLPACKHEKLQLKVEVNCLV